MKTSFNWSEEIRARLSSPVMLNGGKGRFCVSCSNRPEVSKDVARGISSLPTLLSGPSSTGNINWPHEHLFNKHLLSTYYVQGNVTVHTAGMADQLLFITEMNEVKKTCTQITIIPDRDRQQLQGYRRPRGQTVQSLHKDKAKKDDLNWALKNGSNVAMGEGKGKGTPSRDKGTCRLTEARKNRKWKGDSRYGAIL